MYKDLWQLFSKEYGGLRQGLSICGVTIVVSLLEGINIALLVPMLETLASPGQEGGHWVSRGFATLFEEVGVPFTLGSILLGLAIIVLGIGALKYLRFILIERTHTAFTAWMRSKLMGNLLSAGMGHLHGQNMGVLADELTTQSSRAGSSVIHITEILSGIGILVVYLITAFLVAPLLAAVALGTSCIMTLAMQYYISRTRAIAITLVNRETGLQSTGIENLNGIHVIKSFGIEQLRWDEFRNHAKSVRDSMFSIGRDRSRMTVFQEIGLFGIIGAIVFIGTTVMNASIAIIVALLFILYRAMPRVSTLNVRRQPLATSLVSLNRVKSSMDQAAATQMIDGEQRFSDLCRGVEFKDIAFSYNGSGLVLRDTNFAFEKGKMTAITGASGAGKTTLIDLILRFYDSTHGKILVDGVDLRELDLESWRNSIGVVSQDIFLFNDTITYNISLGKPELGMEEIKTAARRAYAHDFIEELPEGYNTKIGDRGWNLSGGQRQRLALARAILRNPAILILDEATSALDSESERLIQSYLAEIRGTCTVIVVAHRLATIQNADKIIVLQDGEIAEEGDWNSLLAKNGIFASYYNLQSGLTKNVEAELEYQTGGPV